MKFKRGYKVSTWPDYCRRPAEMGCRRHVPQEHHDPREDTLQFVFYEGSPSANGLPGIHHVMARTIKDVFCRYKTQQGYLA